VFKKLYLDKVLSERIPGPALARQTICPPAAIINFCYIINNTAFYRDFAIARRTNTCVNSLKPKKLNRSDLFRFIRQISISMRLSEHNSHLNNFFTIRKSWSLIRNLLPLLSTDKRNSKTI
jgi:hypothetical protein